MYTITYVNITFSLTCVSLGLCINNISESTTSPHATQAGLVAGFPPFDFHILQIQVGFRDVGPSALPERYVFSSPKMRSTCRWDKYSEV